MKKIIFGLIFVLFSVTGFAQLNGNFKSVRFVNVLDSNSVFPIDATIYYNEQSNKFRAYENGVWKDLINNASSGGNVTGAFVATRIPFASNGFTLTDAAGFTYASSRVTVPALTVSDLTTTRIPYVSTGGILKDESAFSYDETLNLILLNNVAGTFTTSIFGGEIQLDDIAGGDDLTINDSGIIATGSPSFDIGTNSSDLTLVSSSGDLEVSAIGAISQGSYTPTVSNQTGITVTGAAVTNWFRVGNSVTVYGNVVITSTTAAATATFDLSTPIASNIGVVDAGGAGIITQNGATKLTAAVGIYGASANNVRFSMDAPSRTASTLPYTYSFVIK